MKQISILDLNFRQTAEIVQVNCADSLRERLSNMGLSPGVDITPLFQSPFGSPRAYRALESVIALRNSDAEHIMVEVSECEADEQAEK